MTPREIVLHALEFDAPPRVPRQLWLLEWAGLTYGEEISSITEQFPDDIVTAPAFLSREPRTQGRSPAVGRYIDPWGAIFENLQAGVIGEVKEALIADPEYADCDRVHFPLEWLTIDSARVDEWCRAQDAFVLSEACPRPFEQMQFLRGTEALYIDLATENPGMISLLGSMHEFYCEQLEIWCKTDVDGVMMMDDWGAQNALLIAPELWRRIFKPLYAEYIAIAHRAGKKAFMHSDGNILAIYPDLIEIGLDAINSQLFCMGIEQLEPFAGRITFWGEIDRQHLLPYGTPAEVEAAVVEVHRHLWRRGGCIAQCEFGAGAKPENIRQVFATWERLS